MTRILVFASNLLVGAAAAAAFVLVAGRAPLSGESVLEAVRLSWWAGLSVGLTVAVGATVGRKPVLPVHKCMLAQAGIVIGSVVGGLVGSLFPEEIARADHAFHRLLEQQGIIIGAGIGTVVSTVLEIFHVYRMRRRAERERERG